MRLRIVAIATVISISGCQCGPTPCETDSQGEGITAEVCIPGGSFEMGHEKLPPAEVHVGYTAMPRNDWAPARTVTLRPFHIDSHEVTWGQYRACVDAGICSTRGLETYPETRKALRDPALENHPADAITYAEALTYCTWVGKRLPTEAEWERAARGTDGRDYPWGNTLPSLELLLTERSYVTEDRRPDAVGSHPEDVTPEGVFDLLVSVPEWVLDYYDPFYYEQGPSDNPTGPGEPVFLDVRHEYGQGNYVSAHGERVVRGSSPAYLGGDDWDHRRGAPVWFREPQDPGFGFGFRCARDDRPLGTPPPNGLWRYRNLDWTTLPEVRR